MSTVETLDRIHLVNHSSVPLLPALEQVLKKVIHLLDRHYMEWNGGIGENKTFLKRQFERIASCERKLMDIEESTVAQKIAIFRGNFPFIDLEGLAIMKGFLDVGFLSNLYRITDVNFNQNESGTRGYEVRYSSVLPSMSQFDGDMKPPDHFLVSHRISSRGYFSNKGLRVIDVDKASLDPRNATGKLVTITSNVNNPKAKQGQPPLLDVLQISPEGLADMELKKLISFGDSIPHNR